MKYLSKLLYVSLPKNLLLANLVVSRLDYSKLIFILDDLVSRTGEAKIGISYRN